MFDFIYFAVLLGAGATALLDLWALVLKLVFGLPLAPWGLIGRWFAGIPKGTLVHPKGIAQAPAVPRELVIGWVMHYVIGMIFAAVLLAICGVNWVHQPWFFPALMVGLITVGAGWFILQPCIGAGIACSKAAKPHLARLLNVLGHIVFAIGLYGSALLVG